MKTFRKRLVTTYCTTFEFSVTLATGVSLNIEPYAIHDNAEYYHCYVRTKSDTAPGPLILLSYAARYYCNKILHKEPYATGECVTGVCVIDDIPDLISGMVSNADHMSKDDWTDVLDKTLVPELLSGTFDGDDYFNKVATDPALYADLDTNDYHNNVLNYKAFMLAALAKQILSGELVE